MSTYKHSVTLDIDKCKAAPTASSAASTEAIRIRNGTPSSTRERCIDCGDGALVLE